MPSSLPILRQSRRRESPFAASGQAELILDADHLRRVVIDGMFKAKISLDIATADFKAMLVPAARGRRAPSIVEHFRRLAATGVEIRLLHAGTPSAAALVELKAALPDNLVIRRCPRLHAKLVVVDCKKLYVGSGKPDGGGAGRQGGWQAQFRGGDLDEQQLDDRFGAGVFQWTVGGEALRTCRRRNVCPVPLEEPRL